VVTVPVWAWAAFAAFVVTVLALDLFVLHRRAHEVSLREAGAWSALWVAMGLGFGGLLWDWQGGAAAQAYLAGYLVEKSLSLDNVFVFAVIFSAFAIPSRYQHRVLMFGIIGALIMRAAFIMAGATLLESFHEVSYLFGAVLLYAAVTMARGGSHREPGQSRVLRALMRILPATSRLHGQRFLIRVDGRLLATPLLVALVVIETTDVTFAIDSIPAVLAITTDTFVVYTSNVFALLGMRALYFLLAGAAARFRYLQPGLAVILAGVAVKMLTAGLCELPVWASPAFIAAVLGAVAILSARDSRRRQGAGRPASEPAGRGVLGGGQDVPATLRRHRLGEHQPAQRLPAVELVKAAHQRGQRRRLAGVRRGGGFLDGAGGGDVGAQIDRPRADGARRGARHDRHAGSRAGGRGGAGDGGVLRVTGPGVGDQQQVCGALADRVANPVGEFSRRALAQFPVGKIGDRDLADAQDRGGQLELPRPDGLQPRVAGVLRGGFAASQAQQAQAGPRAAEGIQQPAEVLRFLAGPGRHGQDADGPGQHDAGEDPGHPCGGGGCRGGHRMLLRARGAGRRPPRREGRLLPQSPRPVRLLCSGCGDGMEVITEHKRHERSAAGRLPANSRNSPWRRPVGRRLPYLGL
jgi:tellurite resistance protein TerC